MNRSFTTLQGDKLNRLEIKAYDLTDKSEKTVFLKAHLRQIPIPRSNKTIAYDVSKKTGIGISVLGTSEAVSFGAYAFALQKLDQKG